MQSTNRLHPNRIAPQIAVHHLLILVDDLVFRAGEERLVKQIDQEPLQKPLQAEKYQLAVGLRRLEKTIAARSKV